MNIQTLEILNEISAFAKANQWPDIAARAEAIAAKPVQNGALILGQDADLPDGFAETVFAGSPAEICYRTADAVQSEECGILGYRHVVALFRCGELISSTAASLVAKYQAILDKGVAIVMWGAERIQSEDELALVERSLRRLFQAGTGSLASNRIFVISAQPTPAIESRSHADSEAFSAFLRGAGVDEENLIALQIGELVEQIQTIEAHRQPECPVPERATTLEALRNACSDLHIRVFHQLEAERDVLRRAWQVSAESSVADLSSRLRDLLGSQTPGAPRQTLEAFVEDELRGLQNRITEVWTSSAENFGRDMEIAISSVNWRQVNEALGLDGSEGKPLYPDVLFSGERQTPSFEGNPANFVGLAPNEKGTRKANFTYPEVVGGIALGAVLARLALLGPLSLLAMVGAGGLLYFQDRSRQRNKQDAEIERIARALSDSILGMGSSIHAQIENDYISRRNVMDTVFKALGQQLDSAIDKARAEQTVPARGPEAPAALWRERLESLRKAS